MLKNPDIDIAPSLLEGLRLISTPTATAYLMSQGCNHGYVIGVPAQVLDQGQTMVGSARTLRFLPKREDLMVHKLQELCVMAVRQTSSWEILVVSIESRGRSFLHTRIY